MVRFFSQEDSSAENARNRLFLLDSSDNRSGLLFFRKRHDPAPGTATEDDLLRINEAEERLYELVDGTLVEKVMGYAEGFLALLSHQELRRIFLVAFGGFFVFSSVFNYLPFYLSGAPFHASTQLITLLYLSYLIGVFIGPVAGNLSNRIGNGGTMVLGSLVFALAIVLTLIKSLLAILAALALVCAGFFAIHAAAAGSLNRKLTSSRGRATSLMRRASHRNTF